jgi:hypothetical protein
VRGEEPPRCVRSAPDVLPNDLLRALAGIVLRRFHRQTHLLDQIPADEASNAVILPAGGFADPGEGGALLAPQHFPGRWLSLCPRDPSLAVRWYWRCRRPELTKAQ